MILGCFLVSFLVPMPSPTNQSLAIPPTRRNDYV